MSIASLQILTPDVVEHGLADRVRGERLHLGPQRPFALPQQGHALAQLLERQEFLLVGGEQAFDALADPGEFPLQALLALLTW